MDDDGVFKAFGCLAVIAIGINVGFFVGACLIVKWVFFS